MKLKISKILWLVIHFKNDLYNALKSMGNKKSNWIYLILYIVLNISAKLFNYIHDIKTKRS